MIYILEGVDGAGKTTFAKRIQQQTGFEIVHSNSKDRSFEHFKNLLEKDNVILDRFAHSEYVYGNVLRGKSEISYKQLMELHAIMEKKPVVFIYCSASKGTIMNRLEAKGDHELILKNLGKLFSMYYRATKAYKNILFYKSE